MKRFWSLAAFGCAVLSLAAVWFGGLNQDEGWYLYAAQLVSEGQMPYRDFFYTQAPVMPVVYAAFSWVWRSFGLLGARVLTVSLGLCGVAFAAALAARAASRERRGLAALVVFLLLGSNLYHLYYLAIPKTYALASLFVAAGFYLLSFAMDGGRFRTLFAVASGLALAFAAGTRISLGALLAVTGFALLFGFRRCRWLFLWFGLGGALGLTVVYGPFLLDAGARVGFFAAQAYHAARSGFDPVFTVGSLSRLVRWYLPLFVLLGLWAFLPKSGSGRSSASGVPQRAFCVDLLLWCFFAVFAVQMAAPFPYEDYQVPVMGILAVFTAVKICDSPLFGGSSVPMALLALGLTWAASFGSPLLEKWATNGQDRFWTVKKAKCELVQLRDAARLVEAEDPGGKTLLTQDLYLAIETGRKVPKGLEMGPFSMMTDEQWRALLASAPCPVAALSGYSFAIAAPTCVEVPFETQMAYWEILKRNYELVAKEDAFGQNATTLLVLRRKKEAVAP